MSYTNSPLVSCTRLSPHNSGTRTRPIDRITPHHAVGQMSARAICEEFIARNCSANYTIGYNGEVGMSVPESMVAKTSGSYDNDSRAVTIEVADEPNPPYKVNAAAYERLIELCVDICKRNGKDRLVWIDDKDKALAYRQKPNEMLLTVHRWFQYTLCPGQTLLDSMPDLAEKVTAELQKDAKPKLDNTPSKWAKEAVEWAIDNGLMAGDKNGDLMLRSPITREQFCVILKRYHDKFNK